MKKIKRITCLSGDLKHKVEQDYILIRISATFNFSPLVYSTSASGTTFHSAYCTRSTFSCLLLCFSKSSHAVNHNCKFYLSSIYFSSLSTAITLDPSIQDCDLTSTIVVYYLPVSSFVPSKFVLPGTSTTIF